MLLILSISELEANAVITAMEIVPNNFGIFESLFFTFIHIIRHIAERNIFNTKLFIKPSGTIVSRYASIALDIMPLLPLIVR